MTLMYENADKLGLQWAVLKRFKVISACKINLSHLVLGNSLSQVASLDRKWLLNLRIARSTAFRQCLWQSTSWKVFSYF